MKRIKMIAKANGPAEMNGVKRLLAGIKVYLMVFKRSLASCASGLFG